MLTNVIIGPAIDAMAKTSSSEGASVRSWRAGVRECRRARGANADDDGPDDAHNARHVIESEGRYIL